MNQDIFIRRLDGKVSLRALVIMYLARALGLTCVVMDCKTMLVDWGASEVIG